MRRSFVFLLVVLLAACTARTPTVDGMVSVHSTVSARVWLGDLYQCANEVGAVLSLDGEAPQIMLRLGEEQGWTGPVFQVGTEEIVIAANQGSPLGILTLAQVREIFSGRGNPAVQVWAYASGEDIQTAFEQAVMGGVGVTSYARLAVSPEHMLQALLADVNAVGFLPRRSLTGELKELLSVGFVPVLLQTTSEPQGPVRELIACMQKDVGQ